MSSIPIDEDRKVTADQVAEYLQENPDFFIHHEHVLAQLRIPHPSGQAISLVERQVHVLREQMGGCTRRLRELIEIARENEAVTDRMHKLVVVLMEAATFDEMMSGLQDALFDHFQADAVEIKLFSTGDLDHRAEEEGSDRYQVLVSLKEFLRNGRPLCGQLEKAQLEFIFGPLASSVRSCAIVPILSREASGILAIGSRSNERFSASKGILFLTRLGELLSRNLEKLSLPGN